MYTKPAVLALLFAGAQATPSNMDKQTLDYIVEGMLKGALNATGITDDISQCTGGLLGILSEVDYAIADFKKKDAADVLKGFEEIAKVLTQVQGALKNCDKIELDVEKLTAMAAVFSNPETFAYHVGHDLIVNGRDIYSEVNNAISDYET